MFQDDRASNTYGIRMTSTPAAELPQAVKGTPQTLGKSLGTRVLHRPAPLLCRQRIGHHHQVGPHHIGRLQGQVIAIGSDAQFDSLSGGRLDPITILPPLFALATTGPLAPLLRTQS